MDDWSGILARQELERQSMMDALVAANEAKFERERHAMELSEEQVSLLGKALDAMKQSGEIAAEALKVGKQSRNIAIAALVVAALALANSLLVTLHDFGIAFC